MNSLLKDFLASIFYLKVPFYQIAGHPTLLIIARVMEIKFRKYKIIFLKIIIALYIVNH
jgi:hypothetical protein